MAPRYIIPCDVLRDVLCFIPDADVCQLWVCSRIIFLLLEPRLKTKSHEVREKNLELELENRRLTKVIILDTFRIRSRILRTTVLSNDVIEDLLLKTKASLDFITAYWAELTAAPAAIIDTVPQ
uniref:F-box domain-containing protein n=1 Tax=Ditylenchus dipsaci TaxID=166011 RepID=A0A915CM34_9BILA